MLECRGSVLSARVSVNNTCALAHTCRVAAVAIPPRMQARSSLQLRGSLILVRRTHPAGLHNGSSKLWNISRALLLPTQSHLAVTMAFDDLAFKYSTGGHLETRKAWCGRCFTLRDAGRDDVNCPSCSAPLRDITAQGTAHGDGRMPPFACRAACQWCL